MYVLVYLSVMGYMPWYGPEGFTNEASLAYQHVMSIFFERMAGQAVAMLFTLVVVATIFGSAFAMMVAFTNPDSHPSLTRTLAQL